MDNNKGQTIFLSVIGIATLLVAIIGATFAWFSVTVTGNDNASSIIVTTAVLGEIIFTDGPEINLTNIRPETSPGASKTFTIRNSNSSATEQVQYYITLRVVENDLTPVANGMFVHALKDATTSNIGTLITMAETAVPITDTRLGGATATGTLNGYDSHSYVYFIQFKESGSNQNSAQGKRFNGALRVDLIDPSH